MSEEKLPKGSWPAMICTLVVTGGFYLGISSFGEKFDTVAYIASIVVFFVLAAAFTKLFTKQ
jgi:hypothetical protein